MAATQKTLESEIVHYLRDVTNGDSDRQAYREQLRARVGDNIFHGRIPASAKGPYALTLKRINTRRFHDLAAEDTLAQAVIQFTAIGNESPAVVQEICEYALRLSLNSYRGTLGKGPTTIHDVTVERDGMPLPGDPYEGSDNWKFAYSIDFRVSYTQEAI